MVKEESSVQSNSSFTSSLESEDIYEKGENIAKDFIVHNKKKAELMKKHGFMKRTTTKHIVEAHEMYKEETKEVNKEEEKSVEKEKVTEDINDSMAVKL